MPTSEDIMANLREQLRTEREAWEKAMQAHVIGLLAALAALEEEESGE